MLWTRSPKGLFSFVLERSTIRTTLLDNTEFMSNYDKRSIAMHKKNQGKIEVISKVPLKNKDDLSLAYTPGVAAVVKEVAKDSRNAYTHTLKGRTVAIVSDGSAILGLGNLGAEAALPVMEGKAALFKRFAGLDAFPIVLSTQNTEEIIQAVKAIAPTFGGINLEDISAPRCFEIEARLANELHIPVMHDDQHGTAIVVLAALMNACKLTKRKLSNISIVVNGAGAAAIATVNLLIAAGVNAGKIVLVDTHGAIYEGREGLNEQKSALARVTNASKEQGELADVISGKDVFLGMSKANVLDSSTVGMMANAPIVFALANPDPEIAYEEAKKTKIAVLGTGRSDYPNQINNVLAFPGIFRGALDVRAGAITLSMKLAAAEALAKLVSAKELKKDYIIPKPFDGRVSPAVAKAVARAWKKEG